MWARMRLGNHENTGLPRGVRGTSLNTSPKIICRLRALDFKVNRKLHSLLNIWSDSIAVASAMMLA